MERHVGKQPHLKTTELKLFNFDEIVQNKSTKVKILPLYLMLTSP